MTPEEEVEYGVLGLMTEHTYKFAIEIGYRGTQEFQDALERLQNRPWIRLIDVSLIDGAENARGRIMRIFRVLPDAVAWYRRQETLLRVAAELHKKDPTEAGPE